ncbi:MAG: zinc ABC transporter substrate-binding protein [Sedimentisphaerales bacterium]|nr:zinc ABC transporter substrate-binding protein [Sedimentisphaerales bacterium]
MKKVIVSLLFGVGIYLCIPCCTSCRQSSPPTPGKFQVITTLFPLYDFARQIAGDKAEVSLLLPAGVEAHSFEPRPGDIVRISKADLFIYTGPLMEPWAEDILKGITNKELIVINASADILLSQEEDNHNEAHAHQAEVSTLDHEHEHGRQDPHIWVDPVLAQQIVSAIADGFAAKDPANKDYYLANAKAYNKKLADLDIQIRAALEKCSNKTIVYGGHFAFGYFARRYGLEHLSPYAGFSPNAEPTPRKITEMIETLKKAGTSYIYYEELLEPRVARIIAEGAGAELLLLHGAHNISREELEKGVTYLEIMEGNLERLKVGLGYHG